MQILQKISSLRPRFPERKKNFPPRCSLIFLLRYLFPRIQRSHFIPGMKLLECGSECEITFFLKVAVNVLVTVSMVNRVTLPVHHHQNGAVIQCMVPCMVSVYYTIKVYQVVPRSPISWRGKTMTGDCSSSPNQGWLFRITCLQIILTPSMVSFMIHLR